MATKKTEKKPAPKKAVSKKVIEVISEQKKVPKDPKNATPEEKIEEISLEVSKVVRQGNALEVITKEQYEKASQFLVTVVKPRLNRIVELEKFFTDPYVEARRVALAKKQEIETMFGKQRTPLEDTERAIKRAMSNFLLEEDRKARAEEARLKALQDKRVERAEEQGKPAPIMPAVSVERAPQTVKSEGGTSSAKKVWKFEVVNASLVPRQFLEVNEKTIRSAVEGGTREIAGVRIFEDFDISARAR